jgi:hypothetical protein
MRELEAALRDSGDLAWMVENLVPNVTPHEAADEHPASEGIQALQLNAERACPPRGEGHSCHHTQRDQNTKRDGCKVIGPSLSSAMWMYGIMIVGTR